MAPIVDSHLHIWSDDVERYPRTEIPYPGSIELLLQYLDEAGVDHAVIVLPMYYEYDNRILTDALEAHGEIFAGVGVVDPRGVGAAEALTTLVEQGVRGVRVRGTIEADWFCQPETEPLWRRAAELSAPLCLLANPHQVGPMRQMIERFPEATVVIDHFAQIPASDGVDGEAFKAFLRLAEFPRVFIKLSGLHYWGDSPYPYAQAQVSLRAAIDAFGAERVAWGSDWPHILFGDGYIRCLNFVRRELGWLTENQREQILGGTAHRLWWES